MSLKTGNYGNTRAAKKVIDASVGPWASWRTKTRHGRAIRFIETYCRPSKGYGCHKPLKLAPFQRAWLEEVLADGMRAAAMSVARGNGKSTFLAAVGVWALFDPDDGGAPQVPVVATTLMQAQRAVYGVALEMITGEEELVNRALVYSGMGTMRVRVPSTGGEMFPVSNDVDGLQGLDPSLAICDELGFMPAESWNALVLASGKRPRSLVVGIGTPGYDRENALWLVRRRALDGNLRPGFSFTEFAADEGCEIDDPVQWAKANPAMAAGYLDEQAMGIALDAAPSQAAFRIFKLGQWIDGVECWLGEDGRAVWGALEDPWEFLPGAPTWIGVDVGLKHDSTAVVAGQYRPDGRLHAKARVWTPTKSEPVDVTDVMEHIRRLGREFDVQGVLFDPQFFDVPAKMLEDEGLRMVEIRQNPEQMTPLIGTLYELIKRGRFSHDGDPVFDQQILNAVPRFNERGFTLAKSKSRGRIDCAVAAAMMAGRAVRHEEPPELQVFLG